jgi:hypothetical protein
MKECSPNSGHSWKHHEKDRAEHCRDHGLVLAIHSTTVLPKNPSDVLEGVLNGLHKAVGLALRTRWESNQNVGVCHCEILLSPRASGLVDFCCKSASALGHRVASKDPVCRKQQADRSLSAAVVLCCLSSVQAGVAH